MAPESSSRVVSAERVNGCVLIEFADGQNALFPADVLKELAPRYLLDEPLNLDEDHIVV